MTKQNEKPAKLPQTARRQVICLAFESEAQYEEFVAAPKQYRAWLNEQFAAHPELFPAAFAQGYHWHSQYVQKKQGLTLRRLRLKATRKVFTLIPSLVLPYGVGRTDEVEKALSLCQYGVPAEGLAYAFGHDASYWERILLSTGRFHLVGTTVKAAERLPTQLVADEKITWEKGAEVLLATTAAQGCLLGAALASDTSAVALAAAYGEFKSEAQARAPGYVPQSVTTDGFRPTRLAWQTLFPAATLILCFLHGILKIAERCHGALRKTVLDRAWHCYEATTRAQFAQRLRRFDEWAQAQLRGSVWEMAHKLRARHTDYRKAYDVPGAPRTTNAIDRLMNYQDRWLYARRYLHGGRRTSRLAVRAQALLWNFHFYSASLRRRDETRHSPFADLNGFTYHDNWYHNLLVAASLGGVPT
jgi:hypothetical protein